jgi:hypothetical protein
VVTVSDGGRTWTIDAAARAPGPEGLLIEPVLAATAPVTAAVTIGGRRPGDSSWRIAGGPVREGTRTIGIDQEGWRSDEPVTEEARVDLWFQPRGEAPEKPVFTPEQLERLRAIGYAR